MKCLFCKGTLEDKTSAFTVELGGCIVVVKNVPSHVCSQCGETSYGDEVYKELEKVIDELRDSITMDKQLETVTFQAVLNDMRY